MAEKTALIKGNTIPEATITRYVIASFTISVSFILKNPIKFYLNVINIDV